MGDFIGEQVDVSKRSVEIQKSLDDYISCYKEKFSKTLILKDNSVELICTLYWNLLHKEVKPLIVKKVNKYKMASLFELCIVYIQPFCDSTISEFENRDLNSNYAYFVALGIIASMDITKDAKNIGGIKRIEDIAEMSVKHHKQWLTYKKQDAFPIFSNGAFLCVLFELFAHRYQAIMV